MTNISETPSVTMETIRAVSPALANYTTNVLLDDLWLRTQLSPRDRSLLTIASLIARGQGNELAYHIGLGMNNGVTPAEISEVTAHLAFYSGWGNATFAAGIAAPVFAEHGIGPEHLAPATPELLPLDREAEQKRVATVAGSIGGMFPDLAEFTTDILFRDLWLRPSLAPRDRSLVTFAALMTAGQSAQIGFHLNKAMDNGLTREEAVEAVTHLAFYAGWPAAMSAAGVAKDVIEKRG